MSSAGNNAGTIGNRKSADRLKNDRISSNNTSAKTKSKNIAAQVGSSSGSIGSGGGAGMGKLPLPDSFFKVPQLNTKEIKYLTGLAKRACKEVVYYSRRSGGPMNWVHLSSEDGVEVYQGVDESSPESKSLTYLRGATKIYASIDEIADFFKLDTPTKINGFTQTVGKDVMDQKTLCELARPTEDNPKHYVAVKWTAIESPSKLARNRDFCYLECHDEFIDTNTKKRGWVRSLHSIRLPFCPRLNKSHGLVRASFYRSGFIFIESSDKGCVDAIHTLHLDIKGNAPNWMKILVMKRRIKNIAQVNKYFQMQRLHNSRLLGDLELPTKEGVKRCQMCENKFGLFHRKCRCRKCGKVVCTNCGHFFLLDHAGVGPKKVRICMECSETVVFGDDSEGNGNTVKRVKDITPLYDASPSSQDRDGQSMVSRNFSIEEQDYYIENEDPGEMADMVEAKQLNKAFESQRNTTTHLGEENGEENESGTTTLPMDAGVEWQGEFDHTYNHYEDAYDSEDNDLIRGLNDSQEWRHEDIRLQEQIAYEHQRELYAATQNTMMTPQSGRTRVRSSRRSSRDDDNRSGPSRTSSRDDGTRFRQLSHGSNDPIYNEEIAMRGRKDTLDSIRISSDWGDDIVVDMVRYAAPPSDRSNNTGLGDSMGAPVRRSELTMDHLSQHNREQTAHPREQNKQQLPQNDESRGMSFMSEGADNERYEEDYQLARKLSTERDRGYIRENGYPSGPPPDYYDPRAIAAYQRQAGRPYNNHNGHRENPGLGYDEPPPPYRPPPQSALNRRQSFRSDSSSRPPVDNHARRHRSHTELRSEPIRRDVENQALEMAMSAMRMYERERGPNFHVSEDTRQAALRKMMAIYANEIDHNQEPDLHYDQRNGSPQYHPQRSQRLPRYASAPQQHRGYMDDRRMPPPYYGPQSAGGSLNDRRSPGVPDRRGGHRSAPRHHSFGPGDVAGPRNGSYPEYRNLADISSQAFQEYTAGSASFVESSASNRYVHRPDSRMSQSANGYSRQDGPHPHTSLRHSFIRQNFHSPLHSEARSHAADTTYGSVNSSERFPALSRPNSMMEGGDSDSFSEVDLIDLPHLMRKDDHFHADDRLSLDSRVTVTTSTMQESQVTNANNYDHPKSKDHDSSASPLRSVGASETSQPTKNKCDKSTRVEHVAFGTTYSDSSGSFCSEEADYRTSDIVMGVPIGQQEITETELRHYRRSLTELMSEYDVHGREAGEAAAISKTAALQPEHEPDFDDNEQELNI